MWYVLVKKTGVPVSKGHESMTAAESLKQHYLDIVQDINPDDLEVVQLTPEESTRRSGFKNPWYGIYYVIDKETGVPVSRPCGSMTAAETIRDHILQTAKGPTGKSIAPDRLDVVQLSPEEAARRAGMGVSS